MVCGMGRVVQPATCPACDDEFLPNRKNRKLVADQVYCSNRCSAGPRTARQTIASRPYRRISVLGKHAGFVPTRCEPRVCSVDGAIFTPGRTDQVYCTRRCAARGRAGWSPPSQRSCGWCHGEFTPKRNAYAAFCSRACNQSARRAALDGPRRAVKTGVAERDGWVCQIPECGLPVDRTLRFPDPWSASVDHIVLVANGGSNDASNLRLTHLDCNKRRGGWRVAA